MNLITILFWFSLVMSALNWLAFALLTVLQNLPALRRLLDETLTKTPQAKGLDLAELQSAVDPTKLAAAIGALATAFGKSGAAATAAALSVFFALIAAIAC